MICSYSDHTCSGPPSTTSLIFSTGCAPKMMADSTRGLSISSLDRPAGGAEVINTQNQVGILLIGPAELCGRIPDLIPPFPLGHRFPKNILVPQVLVVCANRYALNEQTLIVNHVSAYNKVPFLRLGFA